jgi:hypothetical protein
MRSDEGAIVCDSCGCASDASSEEQAEAYGWLVNRGMEPHGHLCPACSEAAAGVEH